MKFTTEQLLMINGAIHEYSSSLSEQNMWSSEDEKNFTDIVNKIKTEYAKLKTGRK
jgi:hypothetical protein